VVIVAAGEGRSEEEEFTTEETEGYGARGERAKGTRAVADLKIGHYMGLEFAGYVEEEEDR
jgi:hypothetical protein